MEPADREAGRAPSVDEFDVEDLVPQFLQHINRDGVLGRLEGRNAVMRERVQTASAHGRALRHTTRRVGDGRARIGVCALAGTQAGRTPKPPGNLAPFRIDPHADHPVVVEAQDSGPQVAASGALGDGPAIASSLEARR
ncbi:MAG: hypothetical protein ABIO38_03520 [Luteimonas sp.]